MATTITKGTKSAFVGLAVFMLGLSIVFLKMDIPYNIEIAVFLFALTAVIAFFAFIVEAPTADLPLDLQNLQKQLDSMKDISEIVTELEGHEETIESALIGMSETIDTLLKDSSSIGNLASLISILVKYSPELEAILGDIMTAIVKNNIDIKNVDWSKVLESAIKQ